MSLSSNNGASSFEIAIGRHSNNDNHMVYIDEATFLLPDLCRETNRLNTGWFKSRSLWSGVIAGDIILPVPLHAHEHEELANDNFCQGCGFYQKLYDPGSIAVLLVFLAAQAPTEVNLKSEPTPTPRPGWTRIAGACDGQFAYYSVRLKDGRVVIQPKAIL